MIPWEALNKYCAEAVQIASCSISFAYCLPSARRFALTDSGKRGNHKAEKLFTHLYEFRY